jgi:hypothetical protein
VFSPKCSTLSGAIVDGINGVQIGPGATVDANALLGEQLGETGSVIGYGPLGRCIGQ